APWPAEEITARLDDTVKGWRSWSVIHQNYEGPWRDLVHHSGRVLQALTFALTGAIVAAATTSLPEAVGGERNWDYRYTWVRDASLTLEALWVAACPDEAHRFFSWMAAAAAARTGRDHLQSMFGVGGEHDLTERELPHLAGWVALDGAVELATDLGARDRVEGWSRVREEIRAAILERGWSEPAGAFTQSFGSPDLDASALMLPIVGFLPGDDPRVRATVDA